MPANPSPDVEWVRVLQDSWELRKHDHDGCMNHHWWDVPWCISFPCQHTRTRSVARRNCLFMRCVTLVHWSSDTLSIFDPQQHKLNPTTTEHCSTLDTWTCSQDVLADIIRNSFIWNISRWLTAQWLVRIWGQDPGSWVTASFIRVLPETPDMISIMETIILWPHTDTQQLFKELCRHHDLEILAGMLHNRNLSYFSVYYSDCSSIMSTLHIIVKHVIISSVSQQSQRGKVGEDGQEQS